METLLLNEGECIESFLGCCDCKQKAKTRYSLQKEGIEMDSDEGFITLSHNSTNLDRNKAKT